MKRILDFLDLLRLHFLIKGKLFFEWMRVIGRYYRKWKFAQVDLTLLGCYILANPFRLTRQYFQQQGVEHPHLFGETPLTTLEVIARECEITSDDFFLELGMGRGRAAFWLNQFIGCRYLGVELVPCFVRFARKIAEKRGLTGLEFYCQDFLRCDLADASVIYFYGTNYPDSTIRELAMRLREAEVGTKIITVSFPLSDYMDDSRFEVVKVFNAAFTWGEGEVFLQRVISGV
jgi:SAM-dependent methyltransferase